MLVSIKKNTYGLWHITPLEGRQTNRQVAVTECIRMSSVRREGECLIGYLEAVWGLTVQKNVDKHTYQGLVGPRRSLVTWGHDDTKLDDITVAKRVVATPESIYVMRGGL